MMGDLCNRHNFVQGREIGKKEIFSRGVIECKLSGGNA